ncbi:MAG: tyrosine-type recombinase/integrase [Gemmataceae bacterium]
MASLQERNGSWRVLFMHHRKLHTFTLGEVDESEAKATAAKVDYLLMRLKQRLIDLPPGVDIVTFVQNDGKLPDHDRPLPRKEKTLGEVRDDYIRTHQNGALEASSIEGVEIHFRHLCKTLGEGFPLPALRLSDLQKHVDRRSKDKGLHGKKLSPATIRKEIITLRTAWNWAARMDYVEGKFPNRGLVYPKLDEKPPFMTRSEVERQIAAGGNPKEFWDCLYLTPPEIAELLEYVKENAAHPWIYPMFCLAAHAGARRAELIRGQVADVDFTGGIVTVRERKRVHGQRTTRRVPLSPVLHQAMQDWLAVHPGGVWLFCHAGVVHRSRNRSVTTGHKGERTRATTTKGRLAGVRKRESPPAGQPISRNEANDHFERTLKGSKWEVMKGWHVLRHSFVSALASRGVDQRLIDEFVGHETEQQRRRYRHLTPDSKQEAIQRVFG